MDSNNGIQQWSGTEMDEFASQEPEVSMAKYSRKGGNHTP